MSSTFYEDAFKFSKDPLWTQAYEERVKPFDEYKHVRVTKDLARIVSNSTTNYALYTSINNVK